MKYTFVGDIHGKIEKIEQALDNEGLVIFVGDFMDSFDRSVKEHEECLKMVLKAIDDGKAKAIFGNHELSYIHKHHKCSGFSFERSVMFLKYKWEILEKFNWFIQIEDWFISHAGLHPEVQAEIKHPTYLEWAQDWNSSAHWIGHFRGGLRRVGGIFWCDFNKEFEPIYGINQIFGHTAGKDIRKVEIPGSINYCIDCLNHKHEFLKLEI